MKELTKIEEILLLAIWRLGPEAYGVAIRQFVAEMIQRDITYGNLYSALNQLDKKGYVSKSAGETTPERRGRPKIFYRISENGLNALKEARELNEKLWEGVSRYAFDE